jgi:uncharacterized protein
MTSNKTALVVRGGWDGHQPVEATELFIPFLEGTGYDVRVEESPRIYADADFMAGVDLIMQCMTMSSIEGDEFDGLRSAIEKGTGLAGWHGGIADSYRNTSDYLHLIGGQFAFHPVKNHHERIGEQSDKFVAHTVNILPSAAGHRAVLGASGRLHRCAGHHHPEGARWGSLAPRGHLPRDLDQAVGQGTHLCSHSRT